MNAAEDDSVRMGSNAGLGNATDPVTFASLEIASRPYIISGNPNGTGYVYNNGHSGVLEAEIRDTRIHRVEFAALKESFVLMQKWQGCVIQVDRSTFFARLTSLYGQEGDMEAEIDIEEIDPSDRHLIQLGAIFYWSIGYFDKPSGRERTSLIRFQRLPVFSQTDIDRHNVDANRILELLRNADDD